MFYSNLGCQPICSFDLIGADCYCWQSFTEMIGDFWCLMEVGKTENRDINPRQSESVGLPRDMLWVSLEKPLNVEKNLIWFRTPQEKNSYEQNGRSVLWRILMVSKRTLKNSGRGRWTVQLHTLLLSCQELTKSQQYVVERKRKVFCFFLSIVEVWFLKIKKREKDSKVHLERKNIIHTLE